MTTFYETLGITPKTKSEDIKKAYRKLAREFHPDVNKSPEAQIRFKELNAANEVLGDPYERRNYDLHLARGLDTQTYSVAKGEEQKAQLKEWWDEVDNSLKREQFIIITDGDQGPVAVVTRETTISYQQALREGLVRKETATRSDSIDDLISASGLDPELLRIILEGQANRTESRRPKTPTPKTSGSKRSFRLYQFDRGSVNPVQIPQEFNVSLTDILMIGAIKRAKEATEDGIWNVYEIDNEEKQTDRLIGRVIRWKSAQTNEADICIQTRLDLWVPSKLRDQDFIIKGSRSVMYGEITDEKRVPVTSLIHTATLPATEDHGFMESYHLGLDLEDGDSISGKKWKLVTQLNDKGKVTSQKNCVYLPYELANDLGKRAWAWEKMAELIIDLESQETQAQREGKPITSYEARVRKPHRVDVVSKIHELVTNNADKKGYRIFAPSESEWQTKSGDKEPSFQIGSLDELRANIVWCYDRGVTKLEGVVNLNFESVLASAPERTVRHPETNSPAPKERR